MHDIPIKISVIQYVGAKNKFLFSILSLLCTASIFTHETSIHRIKFILVFHIYNNILSGIEPHKLTLSMSNNQLRTYSYFIQQLRIFE